MTKKSVLLFAAERRRLWFLCSLLPVFAACGATSADEAAREHDPSVCETGDCETEDDVPQPCPRPAAVTSRKKLNNAAAIMILPSPTAAFDPVPAGSGAALPPISPGTALPPANPAGPPPPGRCGDFTVNFNEACDDGNNVAGDGCDATCRLEVSPDCPVGSQGCSVCGDGVRSVYEVCDDGNTLAGDGCESDCTTIEYGYYCDIPGQACETRCGDALLVTGESCEDGNAVSGDGCSAGCRPEPGFVCPLSMPLMAATGTTPFLVAFEPLPPPGTPGAPAGPSVSVPALPINCRPAVCGDGIAEGGEACDDGDLNGEGCTVDCRLAPDCSSGDDACLTVCGDGLLLADTAEECDDGNHFNGDGCDVNCFVEPTHVCDVILDTWDPGLPPIYGASLGHSECQATCGDGTIAGSEVCDDGANNGAGYGQCTAQCLPGPRCGDGIVDAEESCDTGDFNTEYASNGCSPTCVPSTYCGDGITQSSFGEECDWGAALNQGAYDGCDASCHSPRCGDGLVQDAENCDDGNRAGGDGCDSYCYAESVIEPEPIQPPPVIPPSPSVVEGTAPPPIAVAPNPCL